MQVVEQTRSWGLCLLEKSVLPLLSGRDELRMLSPAVPERPVTHTRSTKMLAAITCALHARRTEKTSELHAWHRKNKRTTCMATEKAFEVRKGTREMREKRRHLSPGSTMGIMKMKYLKDNYKAPARAP